MKMSTKTIAQESYMAISVSLSLFAGYSGNGCFSLARLSEMEFAHIWKDLSSMMKKQNVIVITS